jgi:hypothetical protein
VAVHAPFTALIVTALLVEEPIAALVGGTKLIPLAGLEPVNVPKFADHVAVIEPGAVNASAACELQIGVVYPLMVG